MHDAATIESPLLAFAEPADTGSGVLSADGLRTSADAGRAMRELSEAEALNETAARLWFMGERQLGRNPSIRTCAAAWNWPKSRAERFLLRLRTETQTETPTTVSPTVSTSTAPDAKLVEAVKARVIALVAAGEDPTWAAIKAAAELGTGATVTAPPDHEKPFDWSSENTDVIIPEQRSIAVYVNPMGSVVIREASAGCSRCDDDDDVFICITPDALPVLVAKLSAILAEAREAVAERRARIR